MKKFIVYSLILLFALGCTKSIDTCNVKATLIGKDLTKCGCCWGWELIIDDSKLLTYSIPQIGLERDSEVPFDLPFDLYIEFTMNTDFCNNRIDIHCAKRK